MTTTCIRDSVVGDAWIQQTAKACPIQRYIDPTTNQPTDNFITGPVRLSFCDLFKLPPVTADNSDPKFGATLLFTPFADARLLQEEFNRIAQIKFSDRYNPHKGEYNGVRSPFRDQSEKLKFSGYTPGCFFLSCGTNFRPPVVDIRMNPILDESKVYPGVWAICMINAYAYNNPKNSGITFGLQSVMIIGDDTKLSGGGIDPRAAFKGVNVQAPITRPDFSAGMPSTGQGAAPQQNFQQGGFVHSAPQQFNPQQSYAPPANSTMPSPSEDDNSWMNA